MYVCGNACISLVKKKICLIKSCQFKNILEEVSVSLSRSTTKRRPHECKYRGLQLYGNTEDQKGQIKLWQRTFKRVCTLLKNVFLTDETKISMCQNDGKSKEKERNRSCEHITLTVKHWRGSIMARGCMTPGWTRSLMFSVDVTADRNSRLNCEV